MDVPSVGDTLFARSSSVGEQPGHFGYERHDSLDGFAPFFWDPLPFKGDTPLPTHPRLRFGRFYRAGRRGGADYHDVLSLGGNRFAITMAAVSGPGASAAATTIRAVVRAHAGRHADSGSLLHHLNQSFQGLWNQAVFATGVCAVLDTRRRTLRLAAAGHPAPLLAREGAPITPLPLYRTMPLGHIEPILTSEFDLCDGDRLLFYTNGISSGDGARRAPYGVERLMSTLQDARELSARRAVDCLAGDIERFAGGDEPDDDQTLLMVTFGAVGAE